MDYDRRMNIDPKNPGEQQAPPQDAAGPPFQEQFQKVIGSWAEATSAGKGEEANAAAMQALMMAAEEAVKNPTPSLLLKQKADDLETQRDWSGAETVRREVLAVEEASGNPGLVAKAQMDLCRLLRFLGRADEAWQFACAATASARRTEILPVLVMALETEAFCALDRGDSARALAAASEAVQFIEPGKVHDGMRAKALATRARCLLANDDSPGAESDLAACWELIQARPHSLTMPGPILTLANWWEVKSQLEERRGNLEGAREALDRAIAQRRQMQSPFALLALARALEKLGELSRAAKDPAGAERALDEAKSIRKDLHFLR